MFFFTTDITPRIQYIVDHLIKEWCGADVQIITDRNIAESEKGPLIIYDSECRNENAFHIIPSGLLSQKEIREQNIPIGEWNGRPALFCIDGGDIPFDILSASFYLLTRYEEYLPSESDEYGRFDYRHSIAYKENFLQLPLINIWAMELRMLLKKKFPLLQIESRKFKFMPTYDIDMAWSYLNKGLKRNMGGWLRSLINRDWTEFRERWNVLGGRASDPYDVYEYLDAVHLRYRLKPIYFFLLAREQKGYDKNIDPGIKQFRVLIAYHAAGYAVGIHPSCQSWEQPRLMKAEKDCLEDIIEKKVSSSRFHYIKFMLPVGYQRCVEAGITDDYSMGYGSVNGFRASVSSSFKWYDLSQEKVTSLNVHPFCWMDATSHFEQGYTPAKAFEELKYYYDIIRSSEGEFITISHINFFSRNNEVKGWKELYDLFMEQIVFWDMYK
ncbi:MAG: DUF7033 domain-containing protein [Chitinophagaceae bacterium]